MNGTTAHVYYYYDHHDYYSRNIQFKAVSHVRKLKLDLESPYLDL